MTTSRFTAASSRSIPYPPDPVERAPSPATFDFCSWLVAILRRARPHPSHPRHPPHLSDNLLALLESSKVGGIKTYGSSENHSPSQWSLPRGGRRGLGRTRRRQWHPIRPH